MSVFKTPNSVNLYLLNDSRYNFNLCYLTWFTYNNYTDFCNISHSFFPLVTQSSHTQWNPSIMARMCMRFLMFLAYSWNCSTTSISGHDEVVAYTLTITSQGYWNLKRRGAQGSLNAGFKIPHTCLGEGARQNTSENYIHASILATLCALWWTQLMQGTRSRLNNYGVPFVSKHHVSKLPV